MKNAETDWRIWLAAGAAVAVAAGVVAAQWMRRPPDPDEEERRRRSQLNQVGRIVEGRIVELMDVAEAKLPARGFARMGKGGAGSVAPNGNRKLVRYTYSISGVSYETAQDVTGMEGRFFLDRLVPGQPASVKYDPSNPGNSILLADDWSGLH